MNFTQKLLRPLGYSKTVINGAVIYRGVFVIAVPLVIMIILNSLLTFYIHQYQKHRGNMRSATRGSRNETAERKLTIMVSEKVSQCLSQEGGGTLS